MPEPDRPIIFFDGVCNLCTGSVKFVLKRDKKEAFLFSSLQSEFAKQTLSKFGRTTELSSFILLENGKIYDRSSAALRVSQRLTAPWPALSGFLVIPKFIRDAVYDFIARHRYQWFGKQDSCMIPTAEIKARFVN